VGTTALKCGVVVGNGFMFSSRYMYGLMEHFLRRKSDTWPVVKDMVCGRANYYRLTAGYKCEERLDHLTKEAKFASSNAERLCIDYKLTVAEKYLETLQDGFFVHEPTI
jgi:hypothetical protein